IDGVRGKLVLCLNQRRQGNARESRRSEIVYAQKLLAEGKAIKPGLRPFFDAQGRLRADQLTSAEQFDGYSCIFCTRQVPPQQMLPLYFDKELIEKAFRSLKGSKGLPSCVQCATGWPSGCAPTASSAISRTYSKYIVTPPVPRT